MTDSPEAAHVMQDAETGAAQSKAALSKPTKEGSKGAQEHANFNKKAAKSPAAADQKAVKSPGPKLCAKNAYAFFMQDKRSGVKGMPSLAPETYRWSHGLPLHRSVYGGLRARQAHIPCSCTLIMLRLRMQECRACFTTGHTAIHAVSVV